MARGTVVGMIWGAVVSVIGAGALSVIVGAPERPAPQGADEPAEPVVQSTQADPEPSPAPVETAVVPAEEPQAESPAPEQAPAEQAQAETPEETPAEEPAEDVAAVAEDPQRPGRRPQPEASVARPDQPTAALGDPAAPEGLGADTTPPSAPSVGEADALPGDAPEAQAPVGGVAVSSDAPVLPTAQAEAPGLPAPDAPDPTIAPEQPPAPPVPAIETALVEDPEEETPASRIDTGDEENVDAAAQEPSAEPETRIGEPVGALTDRGGAVSTRLPRIGGADVAEAPVDEVAPDSPLVRFAASAAADTPDDLPRLAVILIDDGAGPLGPEALRAFPFPITFAITPSHPQAAQAARAYRELGFEVVAMADLPEGAAASDVEVGLAAALDGVPEAVAVLEGPAGGLQGSRDVSTQAAAYLSASGHGLVMQPRGLNTAQALAEREGVPTATLFRDFDGEGQDATAIRRTLDNAAFRARQEGAVVMLGRLRADTVSALVLWGLQDRSGTLALVPVSTVLLEAAE